VRGQSRTSKPQAGRVKARPLVPSLTNLFLCYTYRPGIVLLGTTRKSTTDSLHAIS
jgi:hypothetical protein